MTDFPGSVVWEVYLVFVLVEVLSLLLKYSILLLLEFSATCRGKLKYRIIGTAVFTFVNKYLSVDIQNFCRGWANLLICYSSKSPNLGGGLTHVTTRTHAQPPGTHLQLLYRFVKDTYISMSEDAGRDCYLLIK